MNVNYIKSAVNQIGGLTRAANELRVSTVTVFGWIKKNRVPKLDKALQLASLSGVAVEYLRPVGEA